MKMKKRIVVLLMALVLAVGLIGCKDTLQSIVHKASGHFGRSAGRGHYPLGRPDQ